MQGLVGQGQGGRGKRGKGKGERGKEGLRYEGREGKVRAWKNEKGTYIAVLRTVSRTAFARKA